MKFFYSYILLFWRPHKIKFYENFGRCGGRGLLVSPSSTPLLYTKITQDCVWSEQTEPYFHIDQIICDVSFHWSLWNIGHREVCKYRIIGIKNGKYRNIGMKVVKYRISESRQISEYRYKKWQISEYRNEKWKISEYRNEK